ncbi:MAG: universal stress protein [Marinifilaceae bacterium]|jgi:nucleotide-binding universal stress UspA family protein
MEDSLITILTFEKLEVGCFVKEKFEFEGIECFLTDEGIKLTEGHTPKGIKLKVRANDSERAIRTVLEIHKQYDLDKIRHDTSIVDKKKILVPIDLSEGSINACEYAFGIAEKTNAEIKILYVYDDPTMTGHFKHTTSWVEHERIDAAEAYRNAQAGLLKFGNALNKQIDKKLLKEVKMHFALLRGTPEDVIVALSKRWEPDLVVMGTNGKKEDEGVYSGSVIPKVIENTKYPVLTIPKTAEYKGLDMINIMYATDFNEADNTSLNKLLEIVSPFDTMIHCIHIDIKNDPLKQGKVDELNQFLKKEYSEHNIQCKLFESTDEIRGFEYFVKKNDIDWISFSNPRRTLFYKIFHPDKLKKMVSTSKIPMLVFPI